MSTLIAPFTKFVLTEHHNADTLSVASVGGWQCVVRTAEFESEEYGVYIPIDSVASADHPLLSFLKGERVKTCKLRGVVSQGILLPFSQVRDFLSNILQMQDKTIESLMIEGYNFAPILKLQKYESPIKFRLGEREVENPKFEKYTEIENYRNFKKAIEFGEEVVITEKLHGTNSRFGLVDGQLVMGSKRCQLRLGVQEETWWSRVYQNFPIEDWCRKISERYDNADVMLYGEIAGNKGQDLNYGLSSLGFFAFDIKIGHQFLNYADFKEICTALEIPVTPVLKIGKFEEADLDLRKGTSTLCPTHVREGFVVKPLKERWHQSLGRVILKLISEDYLMRKNAVDITD